MGCVFSQENDGKSRRPLAATKSDVGQNYQRFQASAPTKKSSQQYYSKSHRQQQSVTPRSTANISPSKSTVPQSVSENSNARGCSPEKEEDIHFRRQHFDRNSVLRHSKKRSRRSQSSQKMNTSSNGQDANEKEDKEVKNNLNADVSSSSKLEIEDVKSTTSTTENVKVLETSTSKLVSVKKDDLNTSNDQPRRAITAAEIVQEEMKKFTGLSPQTTEVAGKDSQDTSNNANSFATSDSPKSAADKVKAFLNSSSSNVPSFNDQQDTDRSRCRRSRSRSRENVTRITIQHETSEELNSSDSSKKVVINGEENGRLI